MSVPILWTVLGLSLCISPALANPSPADDLFQQALLKESGEHDLEAAIDLYRQVISQSDAKSLLVFEARLRLGSCYERLDKFSEAEAVYKQIVEFSTSPENEFTQAAADRLARLQSLR